MLDLETMGTRPDATIVQIGAVLFEPVSGGKIANGADKVFNEYVLVQDGAGTIDNGTLAWWLKQPAAAREKLAEGLSDKAITLGEALSKFNEWPMKVRELSWEAIGGVWSHASFDVPVMASAYAKLGQNPPWHYRAPRDIRTLFALAGGPPEIDWTGLTAHEAVDDAIGQAMQVQKCMSILGG